MSRPSGGGRQVNSRVRNLLLSPLKIVSKARDFRLWWRTVAETPDCEDPRMLGEERVDDALVWPFCQAKVGSF